MEYYLLVGLIPLIILTIYVVFLNSWFQQERAVCVRLNGQISEYAEELQKADRYIEQLQQGNRELSLELNGQIALLKEKITHLEQNPKKGEPTIELTDFLRDQSRFGFSFVRVDPASVMLQMP